MGLASTQAMKPKVTLQTIHQALVEALRRRKECSEFLVKRIFRCKEGPANWDAEIVSEDATLTTPENKQAMLAAKLGIQNRFDLAD